MARTTATPKTAARAPAASTGGGDEVGAHHEHHHVHAPDDPRTQDLVRRLKSVEGHVRGIGRMVEDGSYCIDVVNQIVAVQKALKKVNALVLDRHMHTCVTEAMQSGEEDAREKVIGEILEVFQASGKL